MQTSTDTSSNAPDPHLAWERQADALTDRINAGALDSDALLNEVARLHDEIVDTPATTLAGALAQLRFVLRYVSPETSERWNIDDLPPDERALRRAVATLERLA